MKKTIITANNETGKFEFNLGGERILVVDSLATEFGIQLRNRGITEWKLGEYEDTVTVDESVARGAYYTAIAVVSERIGIPELIKLMS